MTITIILAHDEGYMIGKGDGLPWPHLAEDMRRFYKETLGKTVVMGRKTMETLGKPLRFRENIVLTNNLSWRMNGVVVLHDMRQAVIRGGSSDTVFIGGAQIYLQAWEMATRLLITEVVGRHEGDVRFKPDLRDWREIRRERWEEDGRHICDFVEYAR